MWCVRPMEDGLKMLITSSVIRRKYVVPVSQWHTIVILLNLCVFDVYHVLSYN